MKAAPLSLITYLNKAVQAITYADSPSTQTSGVLQEGVLGQAILGQPAPIASTSNNTARGQTVLSRADCFVITLVSGQVLLYTNADYDVTISADDQLSSGNLAQGALGQMILGASPSLPNTGTYSSKGVRLDGLKFSLGVGASADEQTISFIYRPPNPRTGDAGDLINGIPIAQNLHEGLFDGAYITRIVAFMPGPPIPPAVGQTAIGGVILFHGRVSTLDTIGRTQSQMKVKSDLVLLNIDYPRNTFQATCLHTLFDSGCTLNKALFGVAGTVGLSPTQLVVPWSLSTAKYYNQGTISFTSGVNTGLTFAIGSSTASALNLVEPFTHVSSPGDSFIAYPGCAHTIPACQAFNNLPNFRGFPFVPDPSTAY